MKTHDFLLSIAKLLFAFLAALTSISGCTLIDKTGLEASTIEHPDTQYKVLFQRRDYASYYFDFVTNKDQLVLASLEHFDVFDLQTSTSLTHKNIPDARMKSVYVSKDQTKVYIFTTHFMQIWDINNWQLLKELKADKYANDKALFSKDETFLFFAGTLWLNDLFENILEIGNGPSLIDAAFSPDNRYFVITSYHAGTPIIDIKKREWTGLTYKHENFLRVSFRDSTSFLVDSDEEFDEPSNSIFATVLGVFSAMEEDQLESFNPQEKITCWTHDPDYGVLVSLYNGDIYLLDDNLDIQFKWHMEDFARSCTLAKPGEIWLGGEKTGLYKVDLKNRRIMHEYQTENPIYTLKVSGDGRYIGFVEQPSAESVITVLTPVSR